jgi:aspartyl protease family protein
MTEKDKSPGASAGRGMLTIMWILLLGGLSFYFSKWEEKKYNPNIDIAESGGSSETRSIILKQNNWGHYVVNGHINGHPVTFMLDTGATTVAIPAKLAHELNLKPGPRYSVSTANGPVEVRGTRIDKLELGSIVFYDVVAAINPGMHDEEILLGMSALKHVDFSQAGDELTITQSRNRQSN